MTEFCPICLLKGKAVELKYLQMNLSEATKMCPDIKCPYPLVVGYIDVFIKQDLMEMKPSLINNTVPTIPQQNIKTSREQPAINSLSSSVETGNLFEEFNKLCNKNVPVSNQGTSNSENLDKISHMQVPNFSNEYLMDLLNFQDDMNTVEGLDPCLDSDIDRLLEEGLRDLASETNDVTFLDNGLDDLNLGTPVNSNKMETYKNLVSSLGHTHETVDGAIRESHKNVKDNSLSNVGVNKLNPSKSQCDNGKNFHEYETHYSKIDISKVKNTVKQCLSREEMVNTNNRSMVQIVKSQDLTNSLMPKLGNQLIVVKCSENIRRPTLNHIGENVVSVTYIDKQNGHQTIYPNSSYQTTTSHQQPDLKQQKLKAPCKNIKTSPNPASVMNSNKLEGFSVKQEVKEKNYLSSGWNSMASNVKNITLAKNEVDKQIGKGSNVQNTVKGLNTGKHRGKFEGFSFNEALKSIDSSSKCNYYIKKEFKSRETKQGQLDVKTSGSKPIQSAGKKLKGRFGKIKSNATDATEENDLNWIKELLM